MRIPPPRSLVVLGVVLAAFLGACGQGTENGDAALDDNDDVTIESEDTTNGDAGSAEATDGDEEEVPPPVTEPPEQTRMPDLVGQTEGAASDELTALGVEDIRYVEQATNQAEGTVLEQLPSAGSEINGPVTLTLAVPLPLMPDYTGQRIGDVRSELEGWDITVNQEFVLSTDRPEGEVLETTPPSGQRIGTEVIVTVAAAPVTAALASDDVPLVESDSDRFSQYANKPVKVNGTLYENSIYAYYGYNVRPGHYAYWEFDLGRDWEIFEATVGLTDDSEFEQQARFRVTLDGAVIWEQDTVKFGEDLPVSLNVSDGLRLKIEAISLEDGRIGMAWGSPRLLGVEGQVPSTGD